MATRNTGCVLAVILLAMPVTRPPAARAGNADGDAEIIFSQPDVQGIGGRFYVRERQPIGTWYLISWQKSPYTPKGTFVPVDPDPGRKTGLSIPGDRAAYQRGMRNAAGATVGQMYGGTVGAYLNSADLSGKGVDAKGRPLPGSGGYKMMITPSIQFAPKRRTGRTARGGTTVYPWREKNGRLRVALDLQVPTAVCAEKKGSLAYANPLLTLIDFKRNVKLSWGPRLFSKRSRGDPTKPAGRIAYDKPSHSWMIRESLVRGAAWLALAPDSAPYQTASWRGWRRFSWAIDRAHAAAALTAMHEQEPGVTMSTDPGDYRLAAFHLNAEITYETAPAALGWSMRNLRIAMEKNGR